MNSSGTQKGVLCVFFSRIPCIKGNSSSGAPIHPYCSHTTPILESLQAMGRGSHREKSLKINPMMEDGNMGGGDKGGTGLGFPLFWKCFVHLQPSSPKTNFSRTRLKQMIPPIICFFWKSFPMTMFFGCFFQFHV